MRKTRARCYPFDANPPLLRNGIGPHIRYATGADWHQFISHRAFLGQGLVDELIFNVAPVLEGKGLNLLLDQAHYQYKDVQLLDFKSLGGDVIQLHYAVGHA